MNSFLIDYTDYMRHLAMLHRELRHSPRERHFFRGELQEFWQQFRSDVRFPCLIVESSDNEYSTTGDTLTKRRNTSFIVADHYDQTADFDAIQMALTRCETIAEQLLGRMLRFEEGNPFVSIDTDSLQGHYLQNEADRYAGYRLSFSGITPACFYSPNAFDRETALV